MSVATAVECQNRTHAPQQGVSYSITSSARSRNASGILSPRALAVVSPVSPQRRARVVEVASAGECWCCQTVPESIYLDRNRSRGASRSDWLDRIMPLEVKIRRFSGAVSGALFAISALLAAFVPAPAAAQTGEPIKIGYSMALTGGLAPNGPHTPDHGSLGAVLGGAGVVQARLDLLAGRLRRAVDQTNKVLNELYEVGLLAVYISLSMHLVRARLAPGHAGPNLS
jgi:hypothetical protein